MKSGAFQLQAPLFFVLLLPQQHHLPSSRQHPRSKPLPFSKMSGDLRAFNRKKKRSIIEE